MKKYISLAVAVSIALTLGSGVALAAEPAASKTTKTETKTTKTADKKVVKSKIEDTKKAAVKTHTDAAGAQLKEFLTKEATLGAKVENRIVKLGQGGKDVTEAIKAIQEVHTLWIAAVKDLESLSGQVDTYLGEMDAKDAKAGIHDAFKKIQAEAQNVHEKMGILIQYLKNGLPDAPKTPATPASSAAPAPAAPAPTN